MLTMYSVPVAGKLTIYSAYFHARDLLCTYSSQQMDGVDEYQNILERSTMLTFTVYTYICAQLCGVQVKYRENCSKEQGGISLTKK